MWELGVQQMKKLNKKKIGAIALSGLLTLGAGAAIGSYAFPQTITEEVVIEKIVIEPVEVIKEVEVEKIVESIVEVDNENLGVVLQKIYDENGDVSYLTSDLFEDELDLIVDRIVAVNDFKAEAESLVKSQFARELERFDSDFDRRDVRRVVVKEVNLQSVDFKYNDAVIEVEVEFRYDSSKYTGVVEVEFYEGKALPISIVSVN